MVFMSTDKAKFYRTQIQQSAKAAFIARQEAEITENLRTVQFGDSFLVSSQKEMERYVRIVTENGLAFTIEGRDFTVTGRQGGK